MFMRISKILIFSLLMIFVSACKTDQLEEYFVQATESSDFFVINIPASVVTFDESKLDSKTLKDIHSIKKMNVLVYKNNFETDKKQTEFEKAAKIINNKHFKTLTKINNKGYEIVFSYKGKPNSINEIIFLGKDKYYNFVIGILKSDDVNINSFFKAAKHIEKIDESQAETVINIFKTEHEEQ